MSNYNKVFLMGNLTRDPLVKHLPSQLVVVEFGMAINRRYRTAAGEDKEEVTFVDLTAFGRQAEALSQYTTKGKPLFVEGRLKFDTWDDKQGGGKRSKLTVVVENFQFLPRSDGGSAGGQEDEASPRKPNHRGPLDQGDGKGYGGKPQREPAAAPFGSEKVFDEADIPFAWEGRRGGEV